MPHDLGVSITLDDITSGYGTIKYCSGLSPRWIKVDSEITTGVATDPPRRAVLRLLAQVARDASVGLIAEGIERPEDLDVRRGGRASSPPRATSAPPPAGSPGRRRRSSPGWLAPRGAPGGARGRAAPEPRCPRPAGGKRPEPERRAPAEGRASRPPGGSASESVRLDVWLDVACLCPTRSRAKAAIEGGKVDVNGSRAKPHREVRPGDRLTISNPRGDARIVVVRALETRSIPKAEARKLYEDVTPAASRGRRGAPPRPDARGKAGRGKAGPARAAGSGGRERKGSAGGRWSEVGACATIPPWISSCSAPAATRG